MIKLRVINTSKGYSLVELMVAMTIGILLLAGLATVYVGNLRTSSEIERANQQIENGRYAMQILTDELRNAGQLATFDPTALATPASMQIPASPTCPI